MLAYLLFLSLLLVPMQAQAYVGPGLIVMGNILGPLLLLMPFVLLLLVLSLRWWVKKIKHSAGQKKMQENALKQEDDQNAAD